MRYQTSIRVKFFDAGILARIEGLYNVKIIQDLDNSCVDILSVRWLSELEILQISNEMRSLKFP